MNIDDVKKTLKAAALADDAVLIEGVHGIGKSHIVKQFAKENGYHIEELFLSQQEVGDIIGIPYITTQNDKSLTTWSVPIWLQRMYSAADNGIPCILFLDELNRGPIDVRQSAFQLVLERQIHEHKLPTVNGVRTMVVGAINPAGDYQVDELDVALLDRFLHVMVEPDTDTFLKWCRKTNVNQVIINYISQHPDRLHWSPKDGGIGSTPRSWAKLGSYMDCVDKIDPEVLFSIIKGKIGKEIGSQFYSFYKNYATVIKIEDIEKIISDNKERVKTIEDMAILIVEKIKSQESVCKTELAHQLAKKYMKCDDILPFLAYMYALEVEVCVAFLKNYQKDEPELYNKIAMIDGKLNGKKLFKRIVDAAYNSK